MIPFFSQGAVKDYVPWRPTWILVAVVALCYARLLLGTTGMLSLLPWADAALFAADGSLRPALDLAARTRQPVALDALRGLRLVARSQCCCRLARDGASSLTGEWALGRAPVHALGMGFFGGMLVAMVTRVTMGHSGRPLRMDRVTLACFVALQLGAASRVLSEIVRPPAAVQWFLLGERGPVGRRRRRLGTTRRRHLPERRASTASRADGRVLPRAASRAHRVRDPLDRTVRAARRTDAGANRRWCTPRGSATRRTRSTPCC